MSKTKKAIEHVAKSMNMSTEGLGHTEDRYYLSDSFTTILASSSEPIKLWAVAHRNFIDKAWAALENNTFSPANKYERVMGDKLKVCRVKPEIDIIYETKLEGIEVVVYTDNTDGLVAEAKRFKGSK